MLVKYYSRCALDVLLCSYFGISSLCGLVFDSIRSILRHVLFSFVNIYYDTKLSGLAFRWFWQERLFYMLKLCLKYFHHSKTLWNRWFTKRANDISSILKSFSKLPCFSFFSSQLPRKNFNLTDLYLFAAEIWFKWINIISTFTENDNMHTMINDHMGLITHVWSTYFGFLYSCIFPRKKLFWYQ